MGADTPKQGAVCGTAAAHGVDGDEGVLVLTKTCRDEREEALTPLALQEGFPPATGSSLTPPRRAPQGTEHPRCCRSPALPPWDGNTCLWGLASPCSGCTAPSAGEPAHRRFAPAEATGVKKVKTTTKQRLQVNNKNNYFFQKFNEISMSIYFPCLSAYKLSDCKN